MALLLLVDSIVWLQDIYTRVVLHQEMISPVRRGSTSVLTTQHKSICPASAAGANYRKTPIHVCWGLAYKMAQVVWSVQGDGNRTALGLDSVSRRHAHLLGKAKLGSVRFHSSTRSNKMICITSSAIIKSHEKSCLRLCPRHTVPSICEKKAFKQPMNDICTYHDNIISHHRPYHVHM